MAEDLPSGPQLRSAAWRNKAIAPYDSHFVSFNFLNPLICLVASSAPHPAEHVPTLRGRLKPQPAHAL
jgi:hypothetical protein